MNKITLKYLTRIFIAFLLFISFSEVTAALRTKVRICAVKGNVQTGAVSGDGVTCPLKQTLGKTECRVVNQATMIETGPDGWANIEYANGRKVKIMPNTKVVLERDIIYVHSGSSWFKVEVRGGDQLHVKTPTAIAGIRGTEFIVNVKKDGTTDIQLIEGSIEVSDVNQQSKMMLAAGMEVTIPAGSSTLNTGLLNIKEKDEWWTNWPTLVPIAEMPSGLENPNTNTAIVGNPKNPIADSHVYAYSYSNWNKANWGKYKILAAGWNPTGGEKRAYLKFDISGIDKSTFEKASLKLYHYHTAGGNSAELGVYTVRSPWNEGNGNYKSANIASPGEVCWISQPQSDQYPVAYFNPGTQTNDFVEVDITALVKSWLEGMPNHGLAIKAGENYLNGPESVYGFYSREHEDSDKRPQLIINDGSPVGGTVGPSTNLIVNGSFETPIVGPYKSFGVGQTIDGWQVINAPVDLTGSYYRSSEGKQSMDLHGSGGFGGIQQSFVTSPQKRYRVSFDFAGNPAGEPKIKEMQISAAGQSQVFKFDCTGKTTGNMGWTSQTWEFMANSTYTTLVLKTLSSSGNDRYGPAIDNIKVYESGSQVGNIGVELNSPVIAGEWEITCNDGNIYKYNLNLVQSGAAFYGDMLRINGSEANSKVEGSITSNGSIEFIRSRGNWKQYYVGRVVNQSGGKAIQLGGTNGIQESKAFNWNAIKAANTSNILNNPMNNQNSSLIVGQWEWFQNGTVTIYPDNTVKGSNGVVGVLSQNYVGNQVIYVITWSNGQYVDKLTLNGNTLEGKNQNGTRVWGKRINSDPITTQIAGQWIINQHNGYKGTLNFQQNQSGQLTGNASWDRYESGTINGQITGNFVEFNISYPNGIKGIYKGTVTQNGIKIENGTVTASDGRTSSTWDATKGNLASIGGQWNITQSTGHYGTLNLQQNTNGQITGAAAWNGNLNGTITGRVSGNSVEFTIAYPGNVTGLYKGTLTNTGLKISNGTTQGSNGVRATWEATR